MKSIKRTGITTIIAIFCFLFSEAQEDYTQSLEGIKLVRIESGTKVKLVAGKANELRFTKYIRDKEDDYDECDECDHEHYEEHEHEEGRHRGNNRSKGLKPVYAGGTDNTGFGMSIEREGDVLRIRDLKSWMQRSGMQVYLPKDVDIYLDCGNMGSARIQGFSSEIEVNTNIGGIYMNDVTGPITAHTSTGLIDVKFSKVNQDSPISINTSTGIVDVTLPTDTKANLELRSNMGSVYTDFDLEIPREDGMRSVGANRKIQAKLNGGGVNISLRSSTGSVYLRKQ